MSHSVLLTDAQLRKTLSAVRSLGARGVRTVVGEKTRFSPTAFSKYCNQPLVYSDPAKLPEEFLFWLLDTLRKYQCHVFMPMDDAVMEITMAHRKEIEALCTVPLPSLESYRKVVDKGKAVKAASQAGLLVPVTYYPDDLEQVTECGKKLGFPLIVKPRFSSGSRGIRVVWAQEDLMPTYLEVHQHFSFPILQEYIEQGPRYDVCMLFNRKSELRASFVQQEIRHFPVAMGPSTVQESVWLPELVEQAKNLMQDLGWYGIAEMEFMQDPRNQQMKFMEINPRFWNSLHLAVLSGVDFPWLLYRLAIDGDIEPVTSYEVGKKCRSLLPADILHFLTNPNRWRMDPPFWAGPRWGGVDDILSWNDPMPGLGFALACCRYLFDREVWKLMFKR